MHKTLDLITRIAVLALICLAGPAAAQDAELPQAVTLYQTGQPEGFGYRIPAIVTATNGDILAFCERRVGGTGDHSRNDMVLRRSTDGGETWTDLQLIHDAGDDVLVDPCATVHPDGRIVLAYHRFPFGRHARDSGHLEFLEPGFGGAFTEQILVRTSDDHGRTWSEPRDITRQARSADAMSAGSPGCGIVIKQGEHAGRIVMANYEMYRSQLPISFGGRHSTARLVYSDDAGETWTHGPAIPLRSDGNPNESQLVELGDGGIMVVSRNQKGSQNLRRTAVTHDFGLNWEDVRQHEDLISPACSGSALSVEHQGDTAVLVICPTGDDFTANSRKNGVVYISTDNGQAFPVRHLIVPGGFAYSCLTQLENGDLGLLYEKPYSQIIFQRIPQATWQAWVEEAGE